MQIKKKPQQGRTVSHINQLDIYRVYYSLLTVNINTQLLSVPGESRTHVVHTGPTLKV